MEALIEAARLQGDGVGFGLRDAARGGFRLRAEASALLRGDMGVGTDIYIYIYIHVTIHIHI